LGFKMNLLRWLKMIEKGCNCGKTMLEWRKLVLARDNHVLGVFFLVTWFPCNINFIYVPHFSCFTLKLSWILSSLFNYLVTKQFLFILIPDFFFFFHFIASFFPPYPLRRMSWVYRSRNLQSIRSFRIKLNSSF